jgi:hypothetical protein
LLPEVARRDHGELENPWRFVSAAHAWSRAASLGLGDAAWNNGSRPTHSEADA